MTEKKSIYALRGRLKEVQDRMTIEKEALLAENPLEGPIQHEAYLIAYTKAEQVTLTSVEKALAPLAWLPVQLNPKAEVFAENPAQMLIWARREEEGQPSALQFGNDLVHAVARAGLLYGWDDVRPMRLAQQIGSMFRDLTHLIAIVYFASYLREDMFDALPITAVDDLEQTVKELAAWVENESGKKFQTPPTQDNDSNNDVRTAKERAPFLHLVEAENDNAHE